MSLLFRKIEDLQDVVVIPSDFPLEKIAPQLLACQRFVARFTGEALIERLTTKLQTQTDLSPLERKLLQLIAVPVANLALFRFANVRNVKLTDQGVFRTQTGNSADAFEWQLERMLAQQESDAWEGLEELHRFLEANRDEFEEYTESEAFKADQQNLIRSATVFNHFYFINDSRLTFYALLPAMRQAQIRKIEPVLGSVFDTLQKAESLTAEQIKILYLARTALAHATMARAIREHIVHVGPAGVQVMAVRTFAQDNYKSTPDQKSIEKAVTYHEGECDSTLEALAVLVAPPSTPGIGSGSGTGVRGGNGLISF